MFSRYIDITREGKYRLYYRFLFFSWSPTFGDGCGNDTGIPVEYDNIIDVFEWAERNDKN